jgi:uncharacterized protein YbcI
LSDVASLLFTVATGAAPLTGSALALSIAPDVETPTLPGFEFRYRLDGGRPTVRSFRFMNTETISKGDMLNFEEGEVDVGSTGDGELLGVAVETLDGEKGVTEIRVIVDGDAVYAVEDPNDRRKGATLDLVGFTAKQGVGPSVNGELTVVVDCSAGEETLVRITIGKQHRTGERKTKPAGGELNAAIARAVVRYHNEHLGRGPTKARAFHRDNVVVVVLEDTMTRAERTLAASGRTDAVVRLREAFQETMRVDLVAAIEELTGRKVVAFMSANNIDPDMAAELFVLDRPLGGD